VAAMQGPKRDSRNVGSRAVSHPMPHSDTRAIQVLKISSIHSEHTSRRRETSNYYKKYFHTEGNEKLYTGDPRIETALRMIEEKCGKCGFYKFGDCGEKKEWSEPQNEKIGSKVPVPLPFLLIITHFAKAVYKQVWSDYIRLFSFCLKALEVSR
jgi:hypothetical protein